MDTNIHLPPQTPCFGFCLRRLHVHQRSAVEIQLLLQENKHSEGGSLEMWKQTEGAGKVNEMDDLSCGSLQDEAQVWLVCMFCDSFD